MFFEVGGVFGGLGLGVIGQIWGKRSIFVVAAVFTVAGLFLLLNQMRAKQTRTLESATTATPVGVDQG